MPAEVCGISNSRDSKLGFIEKLGLRCGSWALGSRRLARIGNWLTLSLGQERSKDCDQRQNGAGDASGRISGWNCRHAKNAPWNNGKIKQNSKISFVPKAQF